MAQPTPAPKPDILKALDLEPIKEREALRQRINEHTQPYTLAECDVAFSSRLMANDITALIVEVERLRAAASVSAVPPKSEWQPIETAPKDGRRLLMFLGDAFRFPDPCVLRWGIEDGGDYEGWIDADEFAPDPQPTHWMPLPLTPSPVDPSPDAGSQK
jgi:hypothetical protein